jgi:hypothetical protein
MEKGGRRSIFYPLKLCVAFSAECAPDFVLFVFS